MANKDLLLKPHNISEDQWWYEDARGIGIYARLRDENDFALGNTHVEIPWRSLRAALARKDK